MQVLTTKEKKQIESKSIEKKAFSLIKLKNLVKEYNKIIKLIQPEMIDYLKEKGFFVFKVKEGKETYEGSIDLLTKKTSRFDVKAFKENYPDLYETYLVSGESNEIRGNVVKTIPYGQRKYGVK
jgi:hypothetical protein|tara:strand:+ start:133 stop:504 length:372 start_codon:yes stop_codon:yes gene_type:complete